MAEEARQEEKVEAKNTMSMILKIILGLVFLVLGLMAIWGWRSDLMVVVRGCIGLFLVLAAIITFAIAKE